MNEEMGLAQQGANRQPTVREVVELLKQGVKPEELIKYGIPEEMIQAAMQMLTQEISMPQENQGLANTVVNPLEEGIK